MRKLILITTVSLLATQAYAGGPRSLSLAASNANQPAAEQPATAAPATPQAPAATQPANVQTATTTPAATPQPATVPTATATAPSQSTAAPVASTRLASTSSDIHDAGSPSMVGERAPASLSAHVPLPRYAENRLQKRERRVDCK